MWRASKTTYLQYANEMATLLRQSLKEPHREKILAKNRFNILDKKWSNGAAVTKDKFDNLGKAMENATKKG